MLDDAELLRCYAMERSEEAFSALVQRHLSLVYQAALRRTNGQAHLAEEVTQTVFLKLAQSAPRLQGHVVLAGWLYVAARHVAANTMRTEQRRQTREQAAVALQAIAQSDFWETGWQRVRPELDVVMDTLGERDRNAVLLRYFENRPYAEIAATLRVSEDAARMRVDRALEKLRILLARRGITSTAVALGGLLAAQSAVAAPAGLASVVTGSVLAGSGVVGATTGTAGLMTFMTTNKIIVAIMGTLALAAGGTAFYEFNEARRMETAIAELNRSMAEIKGRLAEKEGEITETMERLRAAEIRAVAGTASVAGSRSDKNSRQISNAGGARPPSGPVSATASFAGKMDVLYANPEYVQLELERTALGLRERYGALYRRLGLSDSQVLEFEALMVEQQQAFIDVFAAARANGVSLNDPSLRQLNDPVQQGLQSRIEQLLGPEGFKEYKAYTSAEAGNARSSVGNLAMRVYSTDPITPEQAEKLTDIIAANTAKPVQGTGFLRGPGVQDWPAIYDAAGKILSSAQLAALQAANRSLEISRQQSQLSDQLLQQAATNAAK